MENLNILWQDYGVPVLTAIIYVLSGIAILKQSSKSLIGGVLNKGKAQQISNLIVDDCKKSFSDSTIKLSLEPIVSAQMDKLVSPVNSKLNEALATVARLETMVKNLSKAQACSRIITNELRADLLNGEKAEPIDITEIAIDELKILPQFEEVKETKQPDMYI